MLEPGADGTAQPEALADAMAVIVTQAAGVELPGV
jgi:hypothetical protein